MFYVIAEALALHSIEMREHVAKEIAAHDAKENARLHEENARLSNENAALRADRTINAKDGPAACAASPEHFGGTA